MTENDPAHSGSRWEPPSAPEQWRAAPVPAGPSDDDAIGQAPSAARRSGRARRGVLAGAGILVIGGVGGFAAGHALAGTGPGTGGDSPSVVRSGFPGQDGVRGLGTPGDDTPGDDAVPAAPSAATGDDDPAGDA